MLALDNQVRELGIRKSKQDQPWTVTCGHTATCCRSGFFPALPLIFKIYRLSFGGLTRQQQIIKFLHESIRTVPYLRQIWTVGNATNLDGQVLPFVGCLKEFGYDEDSKVVQQVFPNGRSSLHDGGRFSRATLQVDAYCSVGYKASHGDLFGLMHSRAVDGGVGVSRSSVAFLLRSTAREAVPMMFWCASFQKQ